MHHESTLGAATKSAPPHLWGRSADDVAAERHTLGEFLTPVLALDTAAERSNLAALGEWVREHGLELAPHGKTSMAPELWRELVGAGAAALTVATPWQAMVAREAGISSLLLANELVDPVAIAWFVGELDADPDLEFACFVDSVAGLEALARSPGERPVDVLVELGAQGGRAGVRGADGALALAWGAAREPRVRLVGIAGWEGAFGPDRSEESVDRVRRFLADLVSAARSIDDNGFFESERPIVTAGGSAWFDLVEEAFRPLGGRFRRILRSGAFQAHDSAHYARLSPLADRLRPALHCRARVLSRPGRRLAILDAGRRDVPSDAGFPVPLDADGDPMPGAAITELNDQHAFLRLPQDSALAVGDVVRLGISHPCSAFDRWRMLPIVEDARVADPVVVGFLETRF